METYTNMTLYQFEYYMTYIKVQYVEIPSVLNI